MLFFCGMPAAALTVSMDSVTEVLPAAKRSGAALCLQKNGWNVLLLPDADGRPGALFLTRAGSTPFTRSAVQTATELAQRLDIRNLERYDYSGPNEGIAFVAEQEISQRHLLGNTPLQGLLFLLERGYYHLRGINAAGEAELVSRKKHSIDLLLPLTADTLDAVELRLINVTMSTHAADVLAEKLGYGNDNSTESEKDTLKAELNAKEVFYLQRKRKIALAAVGRRYFFGETAGIKKLAKGARGNLEYPVTDIVPPDTVPEAQQSASSAAPEPARPLTPAEALKAYIKHLEEL